MNPNDMSARQVTVSSIQSYCFKDKERLFTKADIVKHVGDNIEKDYSTKTIESVICTYCVNTGIIMKAGSVKRPAWQRPGIGKALYKITEKGIGTSIFNLPSENKAKKSKATKKFSEISGSEQTITESNAPKTEDEAFTFAQSFLIYVNRLKARDNQWETKCLEIESNHSRVVKSLRDTIASKEKDIKKLNDTVIQLRGQVINLTNSLKRGSASAADTKLFNTPRVTFSGKQNKG